MPRGRPSKLTREFLEKYRKLIEEDLMLGMPIELIADEIGISRETFYEWLERGEKSGKGLYKEFSDIVKKGKALFVKRELAVITKAEQDKEVNWYPAAWKLERRAPEFFSKKDMFSVETEGIRLVVDLEGGSAPSDSEDI